MGPGDEDEGYMVPILGECSDDGPKPFSAFVYIERERKRPLDGPVCFGFSVTPSELRGVLAGGGPPISEVKVTLRGLGPGPMVLLLGLTC